MENKLDAVVQADLFDAVVGDDSSAGSLGIKQPGGEKQQDTAAGEQYPPDGLPPGKNGVEQQSEIEKSHPGKGEIMAVNGAKGKQRHPDVVHGLLRLQDLVKHQVGQKDKKLAPNIHPNLHVVQNGAFQKGTQRHKRDRGLSAEPFANQRGRQHQQQIVGKCGGKVEYKPGFTEQLHKQPRDGIVQRGVAVAGDTGQHPAPALADKPHNDGLVTPDAVVKHAKEVMPGKKEGKQPHNGGFQEVRHPEFSGVHGGGGVPGLPFQRFPDLEVPHDSLFQKLFRDRKCYGGRRRKHKVLDGKSGKLRERHKNVVGLAQQDPSPQNDSTVYENTSAHALGGHSEQKPQIPCRLASRNDFAGGAKQKGWNQQTNRTPNRIHEQVLPHRLVVIRCALTPQRRFLFILT